MSRNNFSVYFGIISLFGSGMLESSQTYQQQVFNNLRDQSVSETVFQQDMIGTETVFTFWMEEKSSTSLITREHSQAAPVKNDYISYSTRDTGRSYLNIQ